MSIIEILLIAILVLNILVFVGLVRDQSFTRAQRLFQSFVIWLIPGIGALVIFAWIAHYHDKKEMKKLFPFPLYFLHRKKQPVTGYGSTPYGPG